MGILDKIHLWELRRQEEASLKAELCQQRFSVNPREIKRKKKINYSLVVSEKGLLPIWRGNF